MEFYDFITTLMKIQNTTKTTVKEQLLNTLKNNDVAKDFFQKSLDPYFQFGCKRLPEYSGNEPDRVSSYHFVEIAYTRLLEDKTNIHEFINNVLNTLTKYEYELFVRICKKDPACGVSVALVNRVWPGLIDTGVKLCKAEPYSQKTMKNINFPCYVQKKEDGARCLCFVDTEKASVKFLSSSGKEYQNLIELNNDIWQSQYSQYYFGLKHNNESFVLDGELLVLSNNGTILSRKEGNGILNKSIKGTITEEEASRVVFIVWDYISFSEYYYEKTPCTPYNERLKLVELFTYFSKHCKLIDTQKVYSLEEIINEFKSRLANGDEGIIVKNTNFIWEGKRIKEQIKLKLDLDVTLKVVNWLYGAKGTKYENCLGSLTCTSSDESVLVNVGSGFSDKFRQEFANKYKSIIPDNMFVEIRSNGLIQNDNNEYSLFLPRFIEIRSDKLEADDLNMIKKLQNAKMNLQ